MANDRSSSSPAVAGEKLKTGVYSPKQQALSDPCGATGKNYQPDWNKLQELLTCKYTQDLVDRHVSTFSKLCREYLLHYGGLPWTDLVHLTPLVRSLIKKFHAGTKEYAPALHDLCKVASLPFVSRGASEHLVHADAAIRFVLTLSDAAVPRVWSSHVVAATGGAEDAARVPGRDDGQVYHEALPPSQPSGVEAKTLSSEDVTCKSRSSAYPLYSTSSSLSNLPLFLIPPETPLQCHMAEDTSSTQTGRTTGTGFPNVDRREEALERIVPPFSGSGGVHLLSVWEKRSSDMPDKVPANDASVLGGDQRNLSLHSACETTADDRHLLRAPALPASPDVEAETATAQGSPVASSKREVIRSPLLHRGNDEWPTLADSVSIAFFDFLTAFAKQWQPAGGLNSASGDIAGLSSQPAAGVKPFLPFALPEFLPVVNLLKNVFLDPRTSRTVRSSIVQAMAPLSAWPLVASHLCECRVLTSLLGDVRLDASKYALRCAAPGVSDEDRIAVMDVLVNLADSGAGDETLVFPETTTTEDARALVESAAVSAKQVFESRACPHLEQTTNNLLCVIMLLSTHKRLLPLFASSGLLQRVVEECCDPVNDTTKETRAKRSSSAFEQKPPAQSTSAREYAPPSLAADQVESPIVPSCRGRSAHQAFKSGVQQSTADSPPCKGRIHCPSDCLGQSSKVNRGGAGDGANLRLDSALLQRSQSRCRALSTPSFPSERMGDVDTTERPVKNCGSHVLRENRSHSLYHGAPGPGLQEGNDRSGENPAPCRDILCWQTGEEWELTSCTQQSRGHLCRESDDDVERLKLGWITLANCLSDRDCQEEVRKSPFLRTVLHVLEAEVIPRRVKQHQLSPRHLSETQHRMLVVHAVECLRAALMHMTADFVNCGGLSLLLQLTSWRCFPKLTKDLLNLMLFVCVTSPDAARACTTLLRPAGSHDIHSGAVGTLVDWLRYCSSKKEASHLFEEFGTEERYSLSSQHSAVLLIATLGANSSEARAQLRHSAGLCLLVDEFHAIFSLLGCIQDSVSLTYLLCLVQCIWLAVVGDADNEEIFLQNSGLDIMLEFLQTVPRTLQRHLLGCLTELLQNSHAVHTCRKWRSKATGKTVMQILLHMWLQEQQRFCSITEGEAVQDIRRLLNPGILAPNSPLEGGTFDCSLSDAEPFDRAQRRLAKQAGSHHISTWCSSAQGHCQGASLAAPKKERSASSGCFRHSLRGFGGIAAPHRRRVRQPLELLHEKLDEQEPRDLRLDLYSMAAALSDDFQVLDEELTVLEKQQLESMRWYPECRLLEAWGEVRTRLSGQDICPVDSDKKWMETSIDNLVSICVGAREKQEALAKAANSSGSALLDRGLGDDLTTTSAAMATTQIRNRACPSSLASREPKENICSVNQTKKQQ
ncbi:hypothetical protein BESB_078350 [Besnoitia besnoiti]|uniref:Cilia- and flagella-associated protein 69 ARM repeats domain-containing protein n=1 Tax=Besnoitia besnoiti TaxID=94643 RepID=A0A2A9M6N5_BESBE|nr:hypothetical protein BESB_078350 [Besnoitia besnoiti]PFH33619.1 hypothetical protein BESB_078350 [Besnoitia besnoiti]